MRRVIAWLVDKPVDDPDVPTPQQLIGGLLVIFGHFAGVFAFKLSEDYEDLGKTRGYAKIMAFLTGPIAYGRHTKTDPTELCVYVTLRDMILMSEQCDSSTVFTNASGASLRFGGLEVKAFCDHDEYRAFQEGTLQVQAEGFTTITAADEIINERRMSAFEA